MNKVFGRIVMGLIVFGIPFALASCLDDDEADPLVQLQQDIETIDSYLTSNNINAVKDISGIRMAITKLGTGFPAIRTSEVDVDYIGKLFGTTTVFDEGNATGAVTDFINGWQIALTTLPAGSKATLFIPPYWGYGDTQNGSIPANSILVFDIAFNEVVTSSTELQKLASDTVAIDTYLNDKGIVAVKDTTGLRYVVTELGTGSTPTWYDKIKFKASYKLLSDDSKVLLTIEFAPSEGSDSRVVDQIPNGLKQGLQKLPAGSKATFYLASGLGYGTPGASQGGTQIIPPNANIIIDVEFTEIVQP